MTAKKRAPRPVTPARPTRELLPDWFCEGQQDLLDLFCATCRSALPCPHHSSPEGEADDAHADAD